MSRRPVEPGQYVSIRYAERLAEAGIEPSVGDSFGNALAETVTGLFEAEVIRRRGPRRSLEAFEFAALDRVDRFNTQRPLEPIGDVPPAGAEERYYAEAEEPAPAARLTPNGLRQPRRGQSPAALWRATKSRKARVAGGSCRRLG